MPNSSVPITPGSGLRIAVNQVSGLEYQVVKVDLGGDGVSVPASADGSGNLNVNLAAAAGVVVVNNPTAANLKVDASGVTVPISAASALPVSAPQGSPAFVRLSDGTSPIATLPVSGTTTANQGTANTDANGWPVKITDGTNEAGVTNVSGTKCLNVNVAQTVGAGAQVDKSTFTEGTTPFGVIGGEYNTAPTSPASGQAAAAQITQNRAVHVNLRNSGGTEIGTSGAPVRVDPVGTTTQPVNVGQVGGNAVITAANGVQVVALANSGGTPIAQANPLPVTPAPTPNGGTRWRVHIGITASQTAQVVRTPTTGKTSYILGFILTLTTSGSFTLYDNTDSSTTELYKGTPPIGNVTLVYHLPEPLAAVNDVLDYSSGSGTVGDLTAWGFEMS